VGDAGDFERGDFFRVKRDVDRGYRLFDVLHRRAACLRNLELARKALAAKHRARQEKQSA